MIEVSKLSRESARIIARDVRRTLEKCARLKLLDEFVMTQGVEYVGVHGWRAQYV